jgi:hypothetical protein
LASCTLGEGISHVKQPPRLSDGLGSAHEWRSNSSDPFLRGFGASTHQDRRRKSNETERAVLAGGCFWGMQDLSRRRDGVISTRVGYTGGNVPHVTYRNHGNHAEAIEIIFDPSKITFRELLEFFFQIHDPTTPEPPRQRHRAQLSIRHFLYKRRAKMCG